MRARRLMFALCMAKTHFNLHRCTSVCCFLTAFCMLMYVCHRARNCDSLIANATKLSELFASWRLVFCPITKANHNTAYVFKFLLGYQSDMEASIYTTHLNVPSKIVSKYY